MNSGIEFAQKINLAYNSVCKPLLHKFNLPQTAFDILMFLANRIYNCKRYCGGKKNQS